MTFNAYPSNSTTGASSTYRFTFTPTISYPITSTLTVQFETITLTSITSNCTFTLVNSSSIQFTFSSSLTNTLYICEVNNIINPRSLKPETITALTESGTFKLNQGVTKIVMTSPNIITISDTPSTNKQYYSSLPINLSVTVYNQMKVLAWEQRCLQKYLRRLLYRWRNF